jgi:hypothetical protein
MLDLETLEKIIKVTPAGHKQTCYLLNCGCCKKQISKSKQRIGDRTLHFCQACSATKSSYCKKVYKQNPIFFLEEVKEVYYTAGFIAADGNVSKDGSMLQIKIQQADKIILEKIKEYAEATNPIHVYEDNMCSLRLNNYFWVQDLSTRFNIVPNKSLILEPPNFDLNTKNPELVKSFIVGYVDGDGGIYRRKTNNTLELFILGTKSMVTWISECFTYYYGTEIPIKAINQPAAKTNKVWRLCIYGKKAQTILDDLKQLPIYKLERKWSKV